MIPKRVQKSSMTYGVSKSHRDKMSVRSVTVKQYALLAIIKIYLVVNCLFFVLVVSSQLARMTPELSF